MKFFDDKSKGKTNWWGKNYFYIGTILFIVLNVILFVTNVRCALQTERVWSEFNLSNLIIAFTNIFRHSSWEHLLHNALMIAVGGLYVERKTGTFNFLWLMLGFSFVGGAMVCAGANSFNWAGSSVVWFALFGYILVDYLFSFQKSKRNKTNIILGAVVLVIEYIRAGFYDKIGGGIGWGIVPYQLIYNAGHYIGFIVGAIFALVVCISQITKSKKEG